MTGGDMDEFTANAKSRGHATVMVLGSVLTLEVLELEVLGLEALKLEVLELAVLEWETLEIHHEVENWADLRFADADAVRTGTRASSHSHSRRCFSDSRGDCSPPLPISHPESSS